jgi:hypothetical protein
MKAPKRERIGIVNQAVGDDQPAGGGGSSREYGRGRIKSSVDGTGIPKETSKPPDQDDDAGGENAIDRGEEQVPSG